MAELPCQCSIVGMQALCNEISLVSHLTWNTADRMPLPVACWRAYLIECIWTCNCFTELQTAFMAGLVQAQYCSRAASNKLLADNPAVLRQADCNLPCAIKYQVCSKQCMCKATRIEQSRSFHCMCKADKSRPRSFVSLHMQGKQV